MLPPPARLAGRAVHRGTVPPGYRGNPVGKDRDKQHDDDVNQPDTAPLLRLK